MDNLSLYEFLKLLAIADGGEAIELISKFQSGGLCIEGISVGDVED